jgi:hypothetical protein
MSNTINTLYLEAAQQMALEYGLTELEAEKFANEMLADGVPSNQWQSILAEAIKWAVDGEKAKERSMYE